MPEEYTKTWKDYVEKGVPERIAKARSAASFYNRHGITVKEANTKGDFSFAEEDLLNVDCLAALDILNIESYAQTEGDEDSGAPSKAEDCGCELKHVKASAESFDFPFDFTANDDGTVLVVGTRDGANISTPVGTVQWPGEVLASMANTWEGGTVGRDHETFNEGRILMSEYQDGKAYMLVRPSAELAKDLHECVGVSVEALLRLDGKTGLVRDGKGTGITFLFSPKRPACSPEEGCVAVGEEIEGEKMSENDNSAEMKELQDKLVKAQAAHEELQAAIAEHEGTIESQKEELETLKAFKAEAEKAELDSLKTDLVEMGVAEDTLDNLSKEVLELMITSAKASAEKAVSENVEDSGASDTDEIPGNAEEAKVDALLKEVEARGY